MARAPASKRSGNLSTQVAPGLAMKWLALVILIGSLFINPVMAACDIFQASR